METISAIKKRRSVRKFRDDSISKEAILKILDCVRFAPTARNVQPWDFIVVTDPQMRKKFSSLAINGPFIKEAPVCIVIICQDTKYYLEDGCAATENLLLAATDLGLSACWVAGDKKEYSQDILNLLSVPRGYKLVSMVALGVADAGSENILKKDLKQMVHWGKF